MNYLNQNYEIFPVPQKVTHLSGVTKIQDNVHIIMQGDVKVATLNMLQKALVDKGFIVTLGSEFVEYKTNIYIAHKEQINLKIMNEIYSGQLEQVNKKEGYQLEIQEHVAIIGEDLDGIHYGVVTFNSILDQSEKGEIRNCKITDYPEIVYRGYIEGFYGFPWSHEDRMDLMLFGGKQKLNTYIYAPKDDPYHRKSWRDLYPLDKGKEIAELAEAGHSNNVNFVWTIHPGDSIDLALEEDFRSVITKLEQLYRLGVRQFGILFDDLEGMPDGTQQALFINRVDDEFIKVKGDIRPLITVGTRYCEAWGPSMMDYFKPFVETLHKDIEVMWTGAATMSNIAKEQFDAPKRAIGSNKNLSVWWNYPVNDYCDAKMLMGKIENLSSDLDNVSGFFSNPMNQAQASKQALFCIADHNWNTHAFDCDQSFSASFRAFAPEVAEALEIFATHSCYVKDSGGVSGDFIFEESWNLKEDIEYVQKGMREGLDTHEVLDRLWIEFNKMILSVDTICTQCLNEQLVKELKPFLEAVRLMGQAGCYVVEGIKALQKNDILAMEVKNNVALQCITDMDQCKVLRLKDGAERYFGVEVGTLRVKPFINEMLIQTATTAGIETTPTKLHYNRTNIALSRLGVTAIAVGDGTVEQGASNVIDGSISKGKWCSRAYRPHLTIDLQEVKNIKQYRIVNCGHPEAGETRIWNTKHLQILTSIDGENFTLVDEVADNKDDVINRILFDEIDARYVRLQILEPAQISINGGGHTRIYAFEVFDEVYPEQSNKVLSSEIEVQKLGGIIIKNVKKGDVIALYKTLEEVVPYAVSKGIPEDMDEVIFEVSQLCEESERVFVERVAKGYLPSIRTSKAIRI